MNRKKKILIAVTGASGSLYAQVVLDKLKNLRDQWEEVACVISEPGKAVWEYELGEASYRDYPYTFYSSTDFFAPPSSGSSGFDSMIICPCSAGTLGRIANGTADNLIVRSADVMLKERRKLILLFRESPLSLIHIRNMETLSLAGAIIYPASPGLYTKPGTIPELISPLADRLLEQAGFVLESTYRWGG
jgi:flavin prenyltransferase